MKKAQVSVQTLVLLIALLAVFLVYQATVYPAFRELLFGAGEKGECNLQFLLSHIGGVETGGCKKETIFVTPEKLKQLSASSKSEMEEAEKQGMITPYLRQRYYPGNPKAEEAWALNKLIGEKMIECYDKTMGGKLLEKVSILGLYSTEVVCVICSRIVLTEETQNLFRGTDFETAVSVRGDEISGTLKTDLSEWLQSIKYKKISYTDYVKKVLPAYLETQPEVYNSLTTYNPRKMNDVGIMLVHLPLGTILKADEPDWNWIKPYSYETLTTGDLLPEYKLKGKTIKCTTIIGD